MEKGLDMEKDISIPPNYFLSQKWLVGVLLTIIGFMGGAWAVSITSYTVQNVSDIAVVKNEYKNLKQQIEKIDSDISEIKKNVSDMHGMWLERQSDNHSYSNSKQGGK